MKLRNAIAGCLLSLSTSSLLLAAIADAASRETAEDVQADLLVGQAKTKADHLKIAAIYSAEAKAEAAKAQALRNQAEAYKDHEHDIYGRNILDLIEHTDALARSYQEAADRHEYLAQIHQQIASETKR
jgi:hypothetical protein